MTKPSIITVGAGVIIVGLVSLLTGLHDPVPQWMPYLAVYLIGHGVGASLPSSALPGIASPPSTTAAATPTPTAATVAPTVAVATAPPAVSAAAVSTAPQVTA